MLLIDSLNSLIATAMKSKENVRLNVLREIKSELMKIKTSGSAYTKDAETLALVKMVKRYKEAIDEFNKANASKELINQYESELSIIQEFAPREATEDDIINKVNEIVNLMIENGINLSMKEMKTVMTEVKKVYPTADGGIISKTFRNRL